MFPLPVLERLDCPYFSCLETCSLEVCDRSVLGEYKNRNENENKQHFLAGAVLVSARPPLAANVLYCFYFNYFSSLDFDHGLGGFRRRIRDCYLTSIDPIDEDNLAACSCCASTFAMGPPGTPRELLQACKFF